ncbi:phage tail protein [Ruegeria faecimaris]|uniref:phage tail protein n=1 Tax=Ruegeria faecimaris TaxID=686389 RepID=UPI002492D648|nr:phage tail protein [Ruegeria faecimaris]
MRPPGFPTPPRPNAPGGPLEPQQGWGPSPGRVLGMPVGAVIAFSGELLGQSKKLAGGTTDLQHYGWKVCDGSPLLISAYPELFAAIGYLFGKGKDGEFRLPDYQGYFLRGVDPGGKVDKDQDQRYRTDKKNQKYDRVGSLQLSALQQHQHVLEQSDSTVSNGVLGPEPVIAPTPQSNSGNVVKGSALTSETETRAINISVYWLIKCRSDAVL